MSQHKKQAKPELTDDQVHDLNYITHLPGTEPNPFTITDPTELARLLKAIYRSGATGSPRSMSKDVQTITDLFKEQQ